MPVTPRVDDTSQIIERVAINEAQIGQLTKDMSQLTANVADMGRGMVTGFNNISAKIDEKDHEARVESTKIQRALIERQDQMHRDNLAAGRTKQGNFIAWVGIFVAVIGAVGSTAFVVIGLAVGWAITSMGTQVDHEREMRVAASGSQAALREVAKEFDREQYAGIQADLSELKRQATEGIATDRDSQITRNRLRMDVDRIESLIASQYKELDGKLQREMLLMDQTTQKAVDELAKRFDREMGYIRAGINVLDQKTGGAGLLAPRDVSSDTITPRGH